MQQQMFCTGTNWTDLVISDLKDMIIIHVKRNNKFSRNIVPKLKDFYNRHILPELAYPRIAYGLSRVSKHLDDARQL